uniref:RNA-directed DNA polymerase n=1 Tax=Glypta fumiferanae TaxID=389681 RepID=A0A0F6QAA3_9HYME|nr:pol polyprotein [Glypta fumiferanae]
MVSTAIGKKATSISRQVLIQTIIEGKSIEYPFLVVPYLTSDVILGHDWLSRNRVIINYDEGTVTIRGKLLSSTSVEFERSPSHTLVCSQRGDTTYVFVINVNEILANNIQNKSRDELQIPKRRAITDKMDKKNKKDEGELAGVIKEKNSNANKVELIGNINEEVLQEVDELMTKKNDEIIRGILQKSRRSRKRTKREFPVKKHQQENKSVGSHRMIEEKSGSIVPKVLEFRGRVEKISKPKDNNFETDHDLEVDSGDGFDFFGELPRVACKLTRLDDSQKQDFCEVLKKFECVFSNKPGCAKGYEHQLKLTTDRPNIRHTYPVPFKLRNATSITIKKMIEDQVIERGISPFCNPLRIVQKEDGNVRICLDARFLNQVIEDDQESPPLIHELLQKYHGCKWFSKLDLTHGYWQVPLHKDSRPYTAFLFDSHTYQFCRVPFGIKTAGSGFIRALNFALKDDFRENISCYIDDILIGTDTLEKHVEILAGIFQRLKEYNFTLKLSKCAFLQSEVSFLGYIISSKGVAPAPQKLEIIMNFEAPKNKKQLQQFLGVCNYYRKFNVRHSSSVDKLRELLTKNVPWIWTQAHGEAFENMKKDFGRSITLKHIIPGARFRVQTDASDRGIAGILYQVDSLGDHNVVDVVSRCLNQFEVKYTTTEKELLAIVYSIEKFRVYLIGVHFEVVTDHMSLTFLHSARFYNARISRWVILLQQYTFSISYCKGVDNLVADFFSRNPEGKFCDENPERIVISSLHRYLNPQKCAEETSLILLAMIKYDANLVHDFKALSKWQLEDAKLKDLIHGCNEIGGDLHFKWYNEILFHRDNDSDNWRIVIPDRLQRSLVLEIHNKLGHPGVYKTTHYLKQFFYWRGMAAQVKRLILCCDLCMRVKYLTVPMEGEYNFVRAEYPNELVTVDFYGPLPTGRGGVQYIFVMLDAFSKYVSLFPMKRATTRMCLKKVFEVFVAKFGRPKRVLSDHGSQFTSKQWKLRLENEQIKVLYSSIRHPQSNPTERVMRELGRLFRTLCADRHTKWVEYVPRIEEILNITVHQSTGLTPHELHFGSPVQDQILELVKFPPTRDRPHENLVDFARENLKRNFEIRKKGQKSVSRIPLSVGDLVLLRVRHLSSALDKVIQKFFHLFEGPYRIVRCVGANAFALAEPGNEVIEIGIYNRSNLRKYYVEKEVETNKT